MTRLSHTEAADKLSALTSKRGVKTQLLGLWQMMKPSIGMLVVITVIPTLIMAGRQLPNPWVAFIALLGTFLASSSAGILNHLVDADIDGTMGRTATRPMPLGNVQPAQAFATSLVCGALGFILLYVVTTPLAAWISLAANAFYVGFYTMFLKRRTAQNIVIGGAAGAVGPLIGWAAITGHLSPVAWVLFGVVFLWTPPHFWALAIRYCDDYKAANIPMLPAVKGIPATRWQIFLYTLLLLPCAVLPFFMGEAGWLYLVTSFLLSFRFCWMAGRLYFSKNDRLAMPIFFYSIIYIFGIFGFLTLDRILGLFLV